MSDWRLRAAALFRALMLVALFVMPMGMGSGGATAHPAMGVMAAGHCDQSAPERPMKAMPGDCAMACASALPATPAAADDLPLAKPDGHGRPALMAKLHGLILDIATPPPRIA